MKKYFILLSLLLMLSISFAQVLEIHYFYGETCPHCSKVKPILDELETKYDGQIEINRYEVYQNSDNRELFNKFLAEKEIERSGVPALFVADEFLVGSKQIPDNLEAIIIENIGMEETENQTKNEELILNQMEESDDTMVGYWGIIQNPFVLLVIVVVLVFFAYKLYNSNMGNIKPIKTVDKKTTKTRRKTKKRNSKTKKKTKRK